MANEVRGLKVGDKVICVSFNSNDLPDNGGFKGWMVDHVVKEIVDDTTIKLQMVKDPEKILTFDFKDDTVNYFYFSPDKGGWYTGIFTNIQMLFDQYRTIYAQIKGSVPETKKEETENENSN